ncbi:hypothetical protein BB560_002099 [Smittium megazygosporum]|uniref:Rhodanese domain-containing protein n=1 Tax=Smittium megazygosporum TaxID=133381 RepID=A0A2T9ZFP6_9FUNG|nr:hypothetical protein BB560_002099 [Smittium megazygosporum]
MGSNLQVISFEEMKKISDEFASDPSKNVILDVRSPSEYGAGHVPGAVNIPVDTVAEAFSLPPSEFSSKFKFALPAKKSVDPASPNIVVYCQAGMRASRAADALSHLGYTENLLVYSKGYSEYGPKSGH